MLRLALTTALVSAALSGMAPERAWSQAAKGTDDRAMVKATVERYLHGLKFNDTTDFHRAFWPDAKLLFIKRDGSLGQLSQAEWYRGFAASAGKEEEGTLEIVSIDVTGTAASVKVLETYATSVYIDYLNLLRIGQDWRIVNKIYMSRPR
jgi:hypothetical protein